MPHPLPTHPPTDRGVMGPDGGGACRPKATSRPPPITPGREGSLQGGARLSMLLQQRLYRVMGLHRLTVGIVQSE